MTGLRALVLLIVLVTTGTARAETTLNPELLARRAHAGDRHAARALAEGYYAGSGGLPQDFAQAARYFQVLSDLGDIRAMTNLGLMYARGIGVPQNMAEAVRKWRFAAANPRSADPGAEYNLGLAYRNGDGIAADPAQALHWMRRAARRGHVLAQTNLGLMYLEGSGTERDDVEGAAWLIVAARRGDTAAQENLDRFADRLAPQALDRAHERAERWIKAGAPRP